MIPIRLSFEAFGPFAKRQDIDFTTFENDRIFLITGPTGSGKTTIFDAITFCLYGTASGAVRDADSFKSDFADAGTVSWAEFEFLVRGKRYRVRREPIQLRLRRNGAVSKEGSTAELTLDDGTILSGTKEVDARLLEVLGINADQFKKIVMLPQGEFRKFLSDDANEKQKTLRKIFSTESLDAFTERLRLRAGGAETELGAARAKCDAVADSLVTMGNEALAAAAGRNPREYAELLPLLRQDVAARRDAADRIQARLKQAKQRLGALQPELAQEQNKKLDLLEESSASLTALLAQNEEIAGRERRLAGFRAVRELAAYEEAAEKAGREAEQAARALELEQSRLAEREAARAEIEAAFQLAQTARDRLPELARKREERKRLLEIANALAQARTQRDAARARCAELTKRQSRLASLRRWAELCAQRGETRAQRERLGSLREAIRLCGRRSEAFQKATAEYQSKLNDFLSGQAALLAGELQEGRPCPVCGSPAHPAPARAARRPVTKEELESEKRRYEEASQALKEQQGASRQLLGAAGFSGREFSRLSEYLPELERLLAELSDRLLALEKEMEPLHGSAESDVDPAALDARRTELAARLAAAEERRAALEERVAAAREVLGGREDPEELQQELAALEEETSGVESGYDRAREAREQLLRELERLREAAARQKTSQKERRAAAEEARERFAVSLREAGLSARDYEQRRRESAEADRLERECKDYRESVARLRGVVETLGPEMAGKSRIDLAACRAEYGEAAADVERWEAECSEELLRLRANGDSLQRLARLSGDFLEKETVFRERKRLFEIASGRWSDKLSFERYVLASYFGDVIANANQRLEQMTNSRYTLLRRTEREKGNRSSGLSLAVFDAYTGKTRHINTLSGGESFKIALSLALGLADIISENSGGIELGTMFIDEGFGSLDQNSLEGAIECLNGLKSTGRYIGIISHVSELREKIPARLCVAQEPRGSYLQSGE